MVGLSFLVLKMILVFLGIYIYIIWYLKSISKIDSFLRDSKVKSFNLIPIIVNQSLNFLAYASWILTNSLDHYNNYVGDGSDSSDAEFTAYTETINYLYVLSESVVNFSSTMNIMVMFYLLYYFADPNFSSIKGIQLLKDS